MIILGGGGGGCGCGCGVIVVAVAHFFLSFFCTGLHVTTAYLYFGGGVLIPEQIPKEHYNLSL